MDNETTFIATGDSFITRNGAIRKGFFDEVKNLISQADVRFTNLEVTVHDYKGAPGAFSGGTWSAASPLVLEEIKNYGLNLLSCANNHALDYSQYGLLETCRNLRNSNFSFAGIGENMSEASEPAYFECNGGTVALISVTSTFHPWWIAGNQRKDISGRPGVNGLRTHVKHTISYEEMNHLKKIAERTEINSKHNLDIKEGFEVENLLEYKFGNHYFTEGESYGTEVRIEEQDRKRVFSSIKEAKRQADYVIVSIHSHEMEGDDKSCPAMFIREFSKDCIDNGANSVLGHGPHIVRGIEIYKERPIFYSLGNFIFQNDTVRKQPADFFEKYGLDGSSSPADGYDARSMNNTIGLCTNPKVWESIIAKWKISEGKLESIELTPIELGFNETRGSRGWPRISKNSNVLEEICRLSKPFGTEISISNGKGIIHLT